jgi:hypothetical protein
LQFVRSGPDIPERLLQAHEDGKVVFFCGAGISYPAKLPGFAGLVKEILKSLNIAPDPIQLAAIKAGQFDTAIGLIEGSIVNGREKVRRAISEILTPKNLTGKAIETHEAILTLGRCRDEQNREKRTRVITTNFDRLFEFCIAKEPSHIPTYEAPLLPIPKNRWDGLVYLHGLIPAEESTTHLDRLVVSSGDFGLAYLTERWAARFVSELFRNYTVCFVGYSINDPVLRYMMDALAADKLLGESTPEMFAFGSFSKGKEIECKNEWKAKNVTAILYQEHRKHFHLHQTLRVWANTYRDGARGKESIINTGAAAKPIASTKQDDFVGRVLWALSDSKGLPAKRFSELKPTPSLDWLEALSERRYTDSDVNRFGIPVQKSFKDENLLFSLIRRPSPHTHSPWMSIVSSGVYPSKLDQVMLHLMQWLLKHLNDPTLLLWIANHGGILHEDFARSIDQKIREIIQLEKSGAITALNDLKDGAPNAVPNSLMRILWRLVLSEKVKSKHHEFDFFQWSIKFRSQGLTLGLRHELRNLLSPMVLLRESFIQKYEQKSAEKIRDIVDWEIVLKTDYPHNAVKDLAADGQWIEALPFLADDFTTLLCDALDLMKELDGADERSDASYLDRPSIKDHPQNNSYYDWTVLIELARDSWTAAAAVSPIRAKLIAEKWWSTPYPIFKRLAFFAASSEEIIPPQQGLVWLLSSENWWLWSIETQREALQLLASIAIKISKEEFFELENSVLNGPPREMFKKELSPDSWTRIVNREILVRLSKLKVCGSTLSTIAQKKFDEILKSNPKFKISEDEKDDFPVWIESETEIHQPLPRSRRELVKWAKSELDSNNWPENEWRRLCREEFTKTFCALLELSTEKIWPAKLWTEALQTWSEAELINRSWRRVAPILNLASDETLTSFSKPICWWLQSVSKTIVGKSELLFILCNRIINFQHEDTATSEDSFSSAINHPIGIVTEALLRCWYKSPLEDGQGLSPTYSNAFGKICSIERRYFIHGRVVLASNLIALYRVDPEWTKCNLLPFFDWKLYSSDARSVWEGFLWSPRLYEPLLEHLKQPILDTAEHYGSLGEHGSQYATFLTFAALESNEIFTKVELAKVMRQLPNDGLKNVAIALVRAMESAGINRSEYWTNRVAPFFESVWPKQLSHTSTPIAENLARLCVAANEQFAQAVEMLTPWLVELPHPELIVHQLRQAGLTKRESSAALIFLDKIIGEKTTWLPSELAECVKEIGDMTPENREKLIFIKLEDLVRRHK